MSMLCRVTVFVLMTYHVSREVGGFGLLGGGGFKFRAPPLGPVSLMPVNGSTRWGDILEDTAQQALDHCKSVRLCNTSGLFSFADSECSDCHPCSCDQGCYSRRDCCVDKQLRDLSDRLVLDPPPPSPLPPLRWGCHSTFVTHYDLARHAFMVDTCLKTWKEEEEEDEVKGCLTPPPNETFSHWPVWSRRTNTVYRNTDCARCNNESSQHVLRWNLKVACDRSVHLRHTDNVLEAMRKALEEPTCQILFVPPEGCNPFHCDPVKGRYIDACNVTGQRRNYDQALWKACETFHGEMTTAGVTYKNVFCAMCNQDRVRASGMCEVDQPFPFFMEMDGASFRVEEPDSKDSADASCGCPDSQVYDPFEDQCRPLQCSMTRQLHEGHCRSIVTNSSGIFYDLALSLTPADPTEPVQLTGTGPLTRVARNIRTAFLLQGSHTTGWHVLTHRFRVIAETEAVPSHPPGRGNTSSSSSSILEHLRILRFKVHIQFCSSWPESSGALEDRLFAMMKSEWNFAGDGRNKRAFNASPAYLGGSEEMGNTQVFRYVSLLSSRGRVKEFVVDIPDPYIESHGGELLETNYYLPISEALKCARVSFNVSREGESGKSLVEVNRTSGTVHHLPSDKFVSFQFVEIGQDGEISICADQLFHGRVRDVKPDFPVHFFSARLFVITITCQALSVFCLVLVLVTYVVFAELRTMAGKNLLGLVSTLSLAVALTGASVFGVGSARGCEALGIAGHFCLLSAFTWALMGLFHSYHMFHSPSGGCWLERCLNEPRTFRKYVLVSVLVPAVIVGVLIVSNVLDGQGDCGTDLGYGRTVCFVSSFNGLVVTICLALLVIVTSVGMSIWALREQRNFPRDRGESFRQHFRHFMSQAFLTLLLAAAVVLQMVSVMLDKEALWYLSLLLYCGLALCILLLFLCRRQTLRLWHAWLLASFVCGKKRRHGHKFSPVDT